MILRVVDIETLGLEPDSGICELGWCDLVEDDGWHLGKPTSLLINPGKPIPPIASAVHHIVDADVKDAPTLADGLAIMAAPTGPNFIFAAHKASFEQSFLPSLAPWICTWKVAIRLAPRAPGHTNSILRYWLNLDLDRTLAVPAHRAAPDAYVTAHLLARMLGKMSVDEMVALSAEPAILPYFIFGKHAMKPIDEVPRDYLEWCLRQDMDVDVKATCRHHLKAKAA